MGAVIVRYKVKADKAEENVAYIKKVFAELVESSPAGLRYASFQGADRLTFVHIASIETEDGSNPLAKMASFAAFQEKIKERCDEPPAPMQVSEVGAYRFLGG